VIPSKNIFNDLLNVTLYFLNLGILNVYKDAFGFSFMVAKRGQQAVGMSFGMIFGVAREIELVDQNCYAILDRQAFGNKFRSSQFNLTCPDGGFCYDK